MKELEEEILEDIVGQIASKNAIVIIPILRDKSNVDEFKIASKTGMTINQIRNILYKLHHHDLVSFTRKKDKKKGWFIYYWTLNKERAIRLIRSHYKKELADHLAHIKNRERKHYYICSRGHAELSAEAALEQNFECIECGELLVVKDETEEINRMRKRMDELRRKIEEMDFLVQKYVTISTRSAVREKARVLRDKKLVREKRAKQRKREFARLNKKKQRKPFARPAAHTTKKKIKKKKFTRKMQKKRKRR